MDSEISSYSIDRIIQSELRSIMKGRFGSLYRSSKTRSLAAEFFMQFAHDGRSYAVSNADRLSVARLAEGIWILEFHLQKIQCGHSVASGVEF